MNHDELIKFWNESLNLRTVKITLIDVGHLEEDPDTELAIIRVEIDPSIIGGPFESTIEVDGSFIIHFQQPDVEEPVYAAD